MDPGWWGATPTSWGIYGEPVDWYGHGASGEVSTMEQAPKTATKPSEEDAGWVQDPSGHFHLRQHGAEVSAYSLVRNKRNGNALKRERKALLRQNQVDKMNFEHAGQFQALMDEDDGNEQVDTHNAEAP